MVLESLWSARKIENKPFDMLIISVVMALASAFLAYAIFPAHAGIIMPLLVTVGMAPLMQRIFADEEETEREEAEGRISESFLDRHGKTIFLFSLFFAGTFLALFAIVLLVPTDTAGAMFSQQLDTIKSITAPTGAFIQLGGIAAIVVNNLRVMWAAFLLSFLLGSGSFFILSWNASILAVYLAGFVKVGLFEKFVATSIAIFPHAPVEILAYFLAGVAGGILSVGVIRENIRSREFLLVFRDALLMMMLAVAAVFAGAAIEVLV